MDYLVRSTIPLILALSLISFYTTLRQPPDTRKETTMAMRAGKYCFILTVKFRLAYGAGSATTSITGVAKVRQGMQRIDVVRSLLGMVERAMHDSHFEVEDSGDILFLYLEPN